MTEEKKDVEEAYRRVRERVREGLLRKADKKRLGR